MDSSTSLERVHLCSRITGAVGLLAAIPLPLRSSERYLNSRSVV